MRTVAALFVAALTVLTGCSADGLPIEEYAVEVEVSASAYADDVAGLFERNVTELETAVSRLQDEFEGEALADAAVSETARLASMMFAGISDATDRYIVGLDGLDATSSVETEHSAYVAALTASRQGTGDLLAALAGAATFEDIDRSIGSSGVRDAQPRVDATCRSLEQAIRALGPAVDLRCVGSG